MFPTFILFSLSRVLSTSVPYFSLSLSSFLPLFHPLSHCFCSSFLSPSSSVQIQDMVAIRHTASNEQQRTTMILLCEDGSLRIYMANVENTSYWLQPSLQPSSVISIMKPVRKRKAAAASE